MKTIQITLSSILVLLFITFTEARGARWQWAWNGGGTDGETAGVILADAEGNTYVIGVYRSPEVILGDLTLTKGANAYSSFIIKSNSEGEVLWYRNDGNIYYSTIAADKEGNLYTTGSFYNSIIFGNDTFHTSSTWHPGGFFVKYDAAGNFVWAHQITGDFQEISFDGAGNMYGLSTFTNVDSISFGGTTWTMRPDVFRDYYLVKYDTAGNFMWAKNYGGMYDICLNPQLAADAGGNVYVAGAFYQDTSYNIKNDTVLFSTTDTAGADFFIAKYDGFGNLLKFETGGAEGIKGDYIKDMVVGANGKVYVTGSFAGAKLHFKNTTLVGYAPCANYFFFQLDSALNLLWEAGGGNVYNNDGNCISVDAAGNVYVGGMYANMFHLDGTHTFTSNGATDFFISKYDASGNLIYCTGAGGGLFDDLYGLSADAQGNVYVSGLVSSDTFTLGDFYITNHPGNYFDIFIAKLSTTSPTAIHEADAGTSVIIYPNPVTDVLRIKGNESSSSEFFLYNMMGAQILHRQLEGSIHTVNVANLPDNVYLYKITSSDGAAVVGKVVKQ